MRMLTIAIALGLTCGPAAARMIVPVTSAIGVLVTGTIKNSPGDQRNLQVCGLRIGSRAFTEKTRW
jgi:hypothetical protein